MNGAVRVFMGKTDTYKESGFSWVKGDLVMAGDTMYIHPHGNTFQVNEFCLTKLLIMRRIFPDSLCEATGFTDKKGAKIFTQAIVSVGNEGDFVGLVKRDENDGAWKVAIYKGGKYHKTRKLNALFEEGFALEVIGNLCDNRALLAGRKSRMHQDYKVLISPPLLMPNWVWVEEEEKD